MNPSTFPEANIVFAKDQSQYLPLPAHVQKETQIATFRWSMSWRERIKILWTGDIWLQIMTFSQPLQPQKLSVDKPNL